MARIPACGTDLSLLQIVQTEYGSHTVSFSMGNWGRRGQSVRLTTYLHLVSRLRMKHVHPHYMPALRV
jgi:hypothetical protein